MTDQQMDARLREAGTAWRAANTISEPAAGEGEMLTISALPKPRRRHSWTLLASAAIVIAALVAGAAVFVVNAGRNGKPASPAPTGAVVGKTWRLSSAETQSGNTAQATRPRLWRVTLTLRSDSTFEFDAYCFGRAGTYKIDGDQLDLSTTGTSGSERCDSGASHAAILDVDGTLRWSITNGRLNLTKGDTTVVFSVEATAAPAIPLLGTPWTFSGYETGRKLPHGDFGAVRGATVVLKIDQTGYRLDTRCLNYSGSASTSGNEIILGLADVAGGQACANPAIENDVAVLPGNYEWLIIGHRLYLSGHDQTEIDFRGCGSSADVCR